ncbi:Uu.00g080330.m01.CDS01 [Anthostomella pinea]|uniref:Uu.00g080330.m01.CDS01 n=1 Tax=Anthostomella pinea TaxID=933095 RepID=A0AAI8VLL6_9PEZI|nr:Uu.00g080330.m01.CDS01 [Anthostomella pinea]
MAMDCRPLAVENLEACFLLFSHLPAELRFKIWALNLPDSRIVALRCDATSDQGSSEQCRDSESFQCTSSSLVPVNLHVCKESRSEAMRRYRLLFSTAQEPAKVFFDPSRDTLYFGARDGHAASEAQFNTFMAKISPQDRALIRHVAINETLTRGDNLRSDTAIEASREATEHIFRETPMRFPKLQQLTFVCNDRNPLYSSDSIFVEPSPENRIIERRIKESIQALADLHPEFSPPAWNVRGISADPNPPVYDQRVLGYTGSRSSFLRSEPRFASDYLFFTTVSMLTFVAGELSYNHDEVRPSPVLGYIRLPSQD